MSIIKNSVANELVLSGRPDNIFQFIEKVAFSDKPHSVPMSYGLHATITHLRKEVSGCSAQIQELSAKALEEQKVKFHEKRSGHGKDGTWPYESYSDRYHQ